MTAQAQTKSESGGAATAAVGALTPEQTLIIQTGASAVPPRWRDKFFSIVSAQLALVPAPTNKDVLEACGVARRILAVGIGPPVVEGW